MQTQDNATTHWKAIIWRSSVSHLTPTECLSRQDPWITQQNCGMLRPVKRSFHCTAIAPRSCHSTSTQMVTSWWRARLITLPKFGMSALASACSLLKVTRQSYLVDSLTSQEIIVLQDQSIGQHVYGTLAQVNASKNSEATTTRYSTPASTKPATSWQQRLQTAWRESTMCLLAPAPLSFKATRVKSVRSRLTLRETKWSRHQVTRLADFGQRKQEMRFSA